MCRSAPKHLVDWSEIITNRQVIRSVARGASVLPDCDAVLLGTWLPTYLSLRRRSLCQSFFDIQTLRRLETSETNYPMTRRQIQGEKRLQTYRNNKPDWFVTTIWHRTVESSVVTWCYTLLLRRKFLVPAETDLDWKPSWSCCKTYWVSGLLANQWTYFPVTVYICQTCAWM
jgi:hypothetical protein